MARRRALVNVLVAVDTHGAHLPVVTSACPRTRPAGTDPPPLEALWRRVLGTVDTSCADSRGRCSPGQSCDVLYTSGYGERSMPRDPQG
jgi:hypothetical protein